MKLSTKQIIGAVCLFVLAMVITFVMTMFGVNYINGLPRPSQDESVTVPKSVCMAFIIFISVILPWLVSLPLIEQARTRIYFLLCLSFSLLTWCLPLGMIFLIHKAHGRGI